LSCTALKRAAKSKPDTRTGDGRPFRCKYGSRSAN